jgi:hypothetical protein
MSDLIGVDTTRFLAMIAKATEAGKIDWETTADSGLLSAVLDESYTIQLRTVPDLEGNTAEPDRTLTLRKGREVIFTIDRRDIDGEILKQLMGVDTNPFRVLETLWAKAKLTAVKITEHISAVERLLNRKT